MPADSLHPALARLAVAYDDIRRRAEYRELSVPEATALMRELVARDDQGVQWTINPATGAWERRQLDGTWVPAAPPMSGVLLPTPHDLAPSRNIGPDGMLMFTQVPKGLEGEPSSLVGALRVTTTTGGPASDRPRRRGALVAVAAAVAVAVVAAGVAGWAAASPDPAPKPAPGASASAKPSATKKTAKKPNPAASKTARVKAPQPR